MQIRSKALIARLRAMGGSRAPHNPAAEKASPLLIYVAVVLALLLAILEVDVHGAYLQSTGLLGGSGAINPIFLSP